MTVHSNAFSRAGLVLAILAGGAALNGLTATSANGVNTAQELRSRVADATHPRNRAASAVGGEETGSTEHPLRNGRSRYRRCHLRRAGPEIGGTQSDEGRECRKAA